MDKCEEVAGIINKHLNNSNYKELLSINKNDIDLASFTNNNNFIQWNSKFEGGESKKTYVDQNKLNQLYDLVKINRKQDFGQFFHFKPFEIACNIIQNREIQLTALCNHSDNDLVEYSEFINRYCHNPLLDDQHIYDAKKDIYIFCFTKHFRNERFWKEYAKDDTGVCIVINFTNFKDQLDTLYDLVDVVYDKNLFDFINHIQSEIFQKFGKKIFIGSDRRFARHFKRAKYSWESEIRMLFDFHENKKLLQLSFCKGLNELDLNNYIKKETDETTGRRYIKLPFNNPFFKLKIDEIICGKKVTDKQMRDIEGDLNNPDIRVWRIN